MDSTHRNCSAKTWKTIKRFYKKPHPANYNGTPFVRQYGILKANGVQFIPVLEPGENTIS